MQFSIYPLELVRTRLAVCPMGTYQGIWDCWRQIVRKEGWSCFYRGLTPSLVGCSFASTLSGKAACLQVVLCLQGLTAMLKSSPLDGY